MMMGFSAAIYGNTDKHGCPAMKRKHREHNLLLASQILSG